MTWVGLAAFCGWVVAVVLLVLYVKGLWATAELRGARLAPSSGRTERGEDWGVSASADGDSWTFSLKSANDERGLFVLGRVRGWLSRSRPLPELVVSRSAETLYLFATQGGHPHEPRRVAEVRAVAKDPMSPTALSIHFAESEHWSLDFVSMASRTQFVTLWQEVSTARSNLDTCPSQVDVFVTTWNLGNAPPPENLSAWLSPLTSVNGALRPAYDLFVIGTQENTYGRKKLDPALEPECEEDSSPGDSAGTTDTPAWNQVLRRQFDESYFTVVAHETSWDRDLTVYVRTELAKFVSEVHAKDVFCGTAGLAGNKGAVAVALTFGDTQMVFINAHLAAHQHAVARRNRDFTRVVGSLRMGYFHHTDITTSLFHHVCFLGDLNYRVDVELEKAHSLLQMNNLQPLRDADQLRREQQGHRAFFGFEEAGELDFRPTYRYCRGSRVYSRQKSRVPSWCDRILFRSLHGVSRTVQRYDAVDEIVTSDHSPVVCRVRLGLVDKGSRRNSRQSGVAQGCLLKFLELRARGLQAMDTSGLSDPYCVVQGDVLLEGAMRTETVNQTLNPEWKRLPILRLLPGIEDSLHAHHLLVTVMDADTGRPHDYLGSCVLWTGQLGNFTETLTLDGVPSGVLEGKWTIETSKRND